MAQPETLEELVRMPSDSFNALNTQSCTSEMIPARSP